MDKRTLSERDICTKYITPALRQAGWDEINQVREEVSFTKGRIIVRGKLVSRGKGKRADYILSVKPNIPIALIEAKENTQAIGAGLQQGLEYAETLGIPFVFSSNGDGFVFHDRTGVSATPEVTLTLDQFPSPAELWVRYRAWKGLSDAASAVALQDYFDDGSGKAPRYYQINAVNAAIEAIAKGQDRVLLVMATGTGKTYTAFQIIWRLWKAGLKKRILFLADRNVLIDQTMVNDFRPFAGNMAKLSTQSKTIERADGTSTDLTLALDKRRRIDTSYEIYLGLYQAITGPDESQKRGYSLLISCVPMCFEALRSSVSIFNVESVCARTFVQASFIAPDARQRFFRILELSETLMRNLESTCTSRSALTVKTHFTSYRMRQIATLFWIVAIQTPAGSAYTKRKIKSQVVLGLKRLCSCQSSISPMTGPFTNG
jgi:type I site-specific restriction endonuclease